MYLDAADEANILLNGLGDAMHERGVINLAYDHNTDQPVMIKAISRLPRQILTIRCIGLPSAREASCR